MASRRLAISSLLCDSDDTPGPSQPAAAARQPSPSPPKSIAFPSPQSVILAPHLLRPRADQPSYHTDRHPSSSHAYNPVQRDFVPLSLQSGGLRRHTPSPEIAHMYVPDRHRLYPRQVNPRDELPPPPPQPPSPPPVRQQRYDPLSADRQPRPESVAYPRYSQSPYSHQDVPRSQYMSHTPPSPARPAPHAISPSTPFRSSRIASHSPSSQSTVSLPSQRSTSQHPNTSPILYSQYPSATPVDHFMRSAQSTSSQFRPSSRHSHPQPPPQTTPRFPHLPHSEPSVSTASAYSPPLPRPITTTVASSSSFPKTLLNPVSPVQSPLGGLEALVQAATVERRRLSGEGARMRAEGVAQHRGPEDLRASSSRSPDVAYRPPVQEPSPRAPVPMILPIGPTSRAADELPPSMDVDADDRPRKRRRRSGSQSGSARIWEAGNQVLERPKAAPTTPMEVRELVNPATERAHEPVVERRRRPVSPVALEKARTSISPVADRRQMLPQDRPVTSILSSQPEAWSEDIQGQSRESPDRKTSSASHSVRVPPKRRRSSGTAPVAPERRVDLENTSQTEMHPTVHPKSEPLDPLPLPLPLPPPPPEVVEERDDPMPSVAFGKLDIQEDQAISGTADEKVNVREPSPDPVHEAPPPVALPQTPIVQTLPFTSATMQRALTPAPAIEHVRALTPPPVPEPTTESASELVQPFDRPSSPPSKPLPSSPIIGATEAPDLVPVEPISVHDVSPFPEARTDNLNPAISPAPQPPPPSPPTTLEEVPVVEPVLDTADSTMDFDIDSELAREFDLAAEMPATNGSMDVDEELLSLVGDTQPPRPPRRDAKTKSTKHETTSTFPPVTLHPSLMSTGQAKAEREMPPPPTVTGARDSDAGERNGTPRAEERPAAPSKKKSKSQPKTVQPKPRAKASGSTKSKSKTPKDREKDKDASAPPVARTKKPPAGPVAAMKKSASASVSASAARSRSTSAMPGPGPNGADGKTEKEKEKTGVEAAEEEEEEDDAEDKLYCVCKTSYDDEKVMIACDRCDEWYHTQCVNMPDLEVDLVDQFICPPCVAKDPHLNLRTTWKRRCLYGQKQLHPNSPSACHRPARGAFSKYCSDECGVKYMQMRITYWAERGGDRERLWENVKNAERVEGVVVSAKLAQEHCNRSVDMDVDGAEAKPVSKHGIPGLVKPKKPKADREMERLQAQLDTVVHSREMMKKELDIVVWREKLTELAVRRSEAVDACGWDQRLCFGDEEVADFGTGVLESYEEMGREGDAMHVDGEGEWWCQGKRKCERHAGWQKLRIAEVQFEKEMKEQALLKLTTHEREIRKRVEDIVDPQGLHASATNTTFASPPRLDPGERKPAANGHSKLKPNGESKKGKKRKAEIM